MAIQRSFQGLALNNAPYATAAIQGTGVNAIHGIRAGAGRNTAPDGTQVNIDASLTDGDAYGYMTEDVNLGYSDANLPSQTGMADRPDWGVVSPEFRGQVTQNYPSPGETNTGAAKGHGIRSINNGADRGLTQMALPITNGDEGWLNKENGQVIEPGSGVSAESQYTIQTSMQQLRRTRAGSQNSGTASKQSAPITSRVPGQHVRQYVSATSARHGDMQPATQHVNFRPFRSRTAGTGRRAELKPNAMYQSQPLTRVSPGDPYQGPSVPLTDDSYGYTYEDGGTY